ncbi:hypothetical protein [Helicobacter cetorum]|uniref:hypothetical protein n=1 Tax=Helicobacter cetorum TaxID=138563 RepID=UPI000CF09630|nr:hypothetical protein [Helicobacter cetorum]
MDIAKKLNVELPQMEAINTTSSSPQKLLTQVKSIVEQLVATKAWSTSGSCSFLGEANYNVQVQNMPLVKETNEILTIAQNLIVTSNNLNKIEQSSIINAI